MKKQPLLNTYVNSLGIDETVYEIEKLIANKKKSYIVPINVDVVVKMETDSKLKEIIDDADLVLVDGKPLVWISKWLNVPVKEKVSGSDLVPKLCAVSSKKGYKIFIIGGKDGVAEGAKYNLEYNYPGINVVGTYSPKLGFENDMEECDKINEIISDSCPDVLLVCLGCPKQEKWIYENFEKYNATVSVCAGATVDFLSGNVKRAPKWMSDHGFEWLYRFLQEPKRLFKRYFVDDVKIIRLVRKYRSNR